MRLATSLFILLYFQLGFCQEYPYRATIQTLCAPEMSGRGYVNEGSQIAAEFIAAEFRKIGLIALQKDYYQHFKFPVQTFPGVCDFIIGTDTLQPGIDYLVDPASAGVQFPQAYTLVYCNVKSLYRNVNAFKPCPKDRMLVVKTSGYGGDTNKVMQARVKELQQFAAVLELTTNKLTWSVSQSVLPYPAFIAQAETFHTQPNTVNIQLESKFYPAYKSSNVLGYLPAPKNTKNKPYIVLTAHYDHLGQMGADTYFPGANDNASGVGMLLYLAQKLAKERNPNFNYVFIAFAGEEAGLLGSKYFVEHPLFPLKQIRFLLNTDIMGSGEEGITVVNATLFKTEFERLQELNLEGSYLTQVKSRGPAANSDHYFFTESGVPAFFVYTMGPNKHYHDIEDKSEELTFAAFEPLSKLLLSFLRSF
ncbi:MAG: hypothetical protein RLZZ65_1418 [Bacteroidota bacterium]|jgi:hypothetical protein